MIPCFSLGEVGVTHPPLHGLQPLLIWRARLLSRSTVLPNWSAFLNEFWSLHSRGRYSTVPKHSSLAQYRQNHRVTWPVPEEILPSRLQRSWKGTRLATPAVSKGKRALKQPMLWLPLQSAASKQTCTSGYWNLSTHFAAELGQI